MTRFCDTISRIIENGEEDAKQTGNISVTGSSGGEKPVFLELFCPFPDEKIAMIDTILITGIKAI